MTTPECTKLRDQLPDLVAGVLTVDETAEARAHLARCADCAAELALLRVIREEEVAAPAGFEARVLGALRTQGRRVHWSAQRLAMAATVALALISAGVLVSRDAGSDEAEIPGLPSDWLGQEVPRILTGAPGLESLSEAELLKLLEELDS